MRSGTDQCSGAVIFVQQSMHGRIWSILLLFSFCKMFESLSSDIIGDVSLEGETVPKRYRHVHHRHSLVMAVTFVWPFRRSEPSD